MKKPTLYSVGCAFATAVVILAMVFQDHIWIGFYIIMEAIALCCCMIDIKTIIPNKDQPEMEEVILNMNWFEQETDEFLKKIHKDFLTGSTFKIPKQFVGTFEDSIPYEALAEKSDSKYFGKYEHGSNFYDVSVLEKAKVEVKDFQNMAGQKNYEVFEEARKYLESERVKGRNLVIPGFDYWKYVLENPSQAPQSMKDGNALLYYMPNAAFCDAWGNWDVPIVYWRWPNFGRGGEYLGSHWSSRCRVVFLEID